MRTENEEQDDMDDKRGSAKDGSGGNLKRGRVSKNSLITSLSRTRKLMHKQSKELSTAKSSSVTETAPKGRD